MIVVLFIVLSLPLALFFLVHGRRHVPPGPPPLPIIGNLHQLRKAKSPYVYFKQLSNKYGPLVHMKLGTIPLVVVNSSELAKQVLRTQDSAFCSRPKFIAQYKLAYDGLDIAFSPYGEYWREVKKIFSVHHVSSKKIQSFSAVREDEASRLVSRVSSLAGDNTVVDMSEVFMTHITLLILRVSCGKRYDASGPEKRKFDEIARVVRPALGTFFVSDYFPSFGWVDKLSGSINRLDRAFHKLDSFYQELIDDHLVRDKQEIRSTEEKEEDILDILIRMKEEQRSSSIDNNGWDNVKALLKNVLLGGIDTSAATLVWIMTALIKAPKAMDKVQQEIRNLLGQRSRVDENDLPKLPYLKAVVKETLRLWPPFPLLVPRETIERCTLEGHQIQPKTVVLVNAWAIARDPDHWENPDEFQPERFLNNEIDIKGQDFRMLPFGSGRRICPGLNLGLANVELTAANLLYAFDWEIPAGAQPRDIDTDPLPGVTMHKKTPLLLVPKKYVA